MNIGILGSGMVGTTLGTRLAANGHQVMLGTRSPEKLAEWQAATGANAHIGTFAETAAFGELVLNAASGAGTLPALEAAGADNLNGKLLIDISNPLDWSTGTLRLTVANTDSLAEQIQRAFPQVRVVKSLNTLSAHLMVNPSALADGDHSIFVAGDDADAKAAARDFLVREFGWRPEHVIDVGDITAARGLEAVVLLWVRMWQAFGTADFQFRVVR